MRKINCDCCKRRYSNAIWYVFDSIKICETCRLSVIEVMRAWGFSLAEEHVFLDEFTGVQPESVIKL